jgi:pyruvate kinase
MIERLVLGGMNVARFNLSHGSYETDARSIARVRKISRQLGREVAILMDLPGPKYRTGKLKRSKAILKRNAMITLTTEDTDGDENMVSVNFPAFSQDVKRGDTVLLDDGAMQLKVVGKAGNEVMCRVIVGGVLTERRGLVVPGMPSSGPFVTDVLKEHLLFSLKQNPDYLAISFVSSAGDVSQIKELLQANHAEIPVISKVERVQAVRNFNEILPVSDGIMVARGDLGVDIPLEKVPIVQKDIIRKCNRAGKPVITATQMLESMINAARPTRAEVTDVANSIFDGSDAIMLSGETSIGKYPLETVKTMSRIALETEKQLPYEMMLSERGSWIEKETDELISYDACHTAAVMGAKAIIAFTQTGSTAMRVSRYRPQMPVIGVTPDQVVHGRLLLYWGVYPIQQIGAPSSVDDMFNMAENYARNLGVAKSGDLIVITGGLPIGRAGATNLLKVERIR